MNTTYKVNRKHSKKITRHKITPASCTTAWLERKEGVDPQLGTNFRFSSGDFALEGWSSNSESPVPLSRKGRRGGKVSSCACAVFIFVVWVSFLLSRGK